MCSEVVGPVGLEPTTTRLWAGSSNQLSYNPTKQSTNLLYLYVYAKKTRGKDFDAGSFPFYT